MFSGINSFDITNSRLVLTGGKGVKDIELNIEDIQCNQGDLLGRRNGTCLFNTWRHDLPESLSVSISKEKFLNFMGAFESNPQCKAVVSSVNGCHVLILIEVLGKGHKYYGVIADLYQGKGGSICADFCRTLYPSRVFGSGSSIYIVDTDNFSIHRFYLWDYLFQPMEFDCDFEGDAPLGKILGGSLYILAFNTSTLYDVDENDDVDLDKPFRPIVEGDKRIIYRAIEGYVEGWTPLYYMQRIKKIRSS